MLSLQKIMFLLNDRIKSYFLLGVVLVGWSLVLGVYSSVRFNKLCPCLDVLCHCPIHFFRWTEGFETGKGTLQGLISSIEVITFGTSNKGIREEEEHLETTKCIQMLGSMLVFKDFDKYIYIYIFIWYSSSFCQISGDTRHLGGVRNCEWRDWEACQR